MLLLLALCSAQFLLADAQTAAPLIEPSNSGMLNHSPDKDLWLRCSGHRPVVWTWLLGLYAWATSVDGLTVEEQTSAADVTTNGTTYSRRLSVSRPEGSKHTGFYTCSYEDCEDSECRAHVYVFVNDPEALLLTPPLPNMPYFARRTVGSTFYLPCRPTYSSGFDLTIFKGRQTETRRPLWNHTSHNFDPRSGFKVTLWRSTEFYCVLTLGNSRQVLVVSIMMQGKPDAVKISSRPEPFEGEVVTTVGGSVLFLCTARRSGDIVLRHELEPARFEKGKVSEEKVSEAGKKISVFTHRFLLKGLRLEDDSQEFSCVLGSQNATEQFASKSLKLHVYDLLTVEPIFEDVAELPGSDVLLLWEVSGIPCQTGVQDSVQTAFYNGSLLVQHDNRSTRHTPTCRNPEAILEIFNVGYYDSGFYSFQASFRNRTVEREVQLIVETEPILYIDGLDPNFKHSGEKFTITCRIPYDQGSVPTVHWFWQPCLDYDCPPSKVFWYPIPDHSLDQGETETSQAFSSSTTPSRQYTSSLAPVSDGRPQATGFTQEELDKLGDIGPPTAPVQNPVRVVTRHDKQGGKRVVSEVIGVAYVSGVYKCEALNYLGHSSKRRTILISEVPSGLVISVSPTVALGLPLEVNCSASAYLLAAQVGPLVLYHRGPTDKRSQPLKEAYPSRPNISAETRSAVIEIHHYVESAGLNDSGAYFCQTSAASIKSQQVTLKETQAPQFLSPLALSVQFQYGKEAVLVCNVTGFPRPAVRWIKDGLSAARLTGVELRRNGTELHFERVSVEDRGSYTCEVSNAVGFVRGTTQVSVADPTEGGSTGDVSEGTIVGAVVGVVCTLVFVVAGMCYLRRRRRAAKKRLMTNKRLLLARGQLNPDLPVDEQTDCLAYDDRWEIPASHLKFGKTLGSGAFGLVMQATAKGIVHGQRETVVAVKMVKVNTDTAQVRALVEELKILTHLGQHVNLVNLLGACTKQIVSGSLYVIVEYCRHGNLRQFLLRHRDHFRDSGGKGEELGLAARAQALYPQLDTLGSSGATYAVADYGTEAKAGARSDSVLFNKREGNATYRKLHSAGPWVRSIFNFRGRGQSEPSEGGSPKEDSPRGEIGVKEKLLGQEDPPSLTTSGASDYVMEVDRQAEAEFVLFAKDLISFCYQVARGMEFLSSKKMIHRDLAARNVLLAENFVLKICDFGLAKDVYKYGEYVKKGDGPLPVKWMALESLILKTFNVKTDVWSFGVLMWEIFTLGETPYAGLPLDQNFIPRLKSGYRLPIPEHGSAQIYQLMLQCWSETASKRPDFTELSQSLGDMLENKVKTNYVSMQQQSPEYLSPIHGSPNLSPAGSSSVLAAAASAASRSSLADKQEPVLNYLEWNHSSESLSSEAEPLLVDAAPNKSPVLDLEEPPNGHVHECEVKGVVNLAHEHSPTSHAATSASPIGSSRSSPVSSGVQPVTEYSQLPGFPVAQSDSSEPQPKDLSPLSACSSYHPDYVPVAHIISPQNSPSKPCRLSGELHSTIEKQLESLSPDVHGTGGSPAVVRRPRAPSPRVHTPAGNSSASNGSGPEPTMLEAAPLGPKLNDLSGNNEESDSPRDSIEDEVFSSREDLQRRSKRAQLSTGASSGFCSGEDSPYCVLPEKFSPIEEGSAESHVE